MQSNRIGVITLLIVFAAAGCHKRIPTAVAPRLIQPPNPNTIVTGPLRALPPEPLVVGEPTTFFSPLELANDAFDEGNYEQARALYDLSFNDDRFKQQRDFILFQSGLTYLLPSTSRGDWSAAAERFRKLDGYPKSPFKLAAQMILSLHADLEHVIGDKRQTDQKLKQLTTELEALKQIDAVNRRQRRRP